MTSTTLDRPMRCGCPDDVLAQPPKTTPANYRIDELPSLPNKAEIFPGTGVIQVDGPWYRSLSSVQRAAVLAHELAHDDDPRTCESCADARAGARLRYAGVGAAEATAALSSVVGARSAGAPLLYGWQVADAAIAERGRTHAPGAFGQKDVAARRKSHVGNIGARGLYDGSAVDDGTSWDDGMSYVPDDDMSAGAPAPYQPLPKPSTPAKTRASSDDGALFIGAGILLLLVFLAR